MNRTRLLATLLSAATAALCTAALSLAAGSGNPATGTTIHLIEHGNTFNFIPAAGPRKGRIAKPGDELAFTASLVTPEHKQAGRTNVACVATTGGKNAFFDCTGIFTLAGGTLVGSAPVRPNANGPTRIAILGGTGAYEGARGSILSVPNKTHQNINYDTLHLLP